MLPIIYGFQVIPVQRELIWLNPEGFNSGNRAPLDYPGYSGMSSMVPTPGRDSTKRGPNNCEGVK